MRQKPRVYNILSPILTLLPSHPLETWMEAKEAESILGAMFGAIQTVVVSTLDSCKGSKLREVETSRKIIHGFVDIRSTFHRCRKSQRGPEKEIGRRIGGDITFAAHYKFK